MDTKDEQLEVMSVKKSVQAQVTIDLVLEKSIFSNVFDKDIRRAYLYKKSERIGKALHLILPAFGDSRVLKERAEHISMALIDASVRPPKESADALARELLALSSVVAMARSSGRLSAMNASIILKEAENLLEEISSYEEPRVHLEEVPTLAALSRTFSKTEMYKTLPTKKDIRINVLNSKNAQRDIKRHSKSNGSEGSKNERIESIVSILSSRGSVYIKDLSTMIRDVSEKTIQRELQKLVLEGRVKREGERRWTRYTLVRNEGAAQ